LRKDSLGIGGINQAEQKTCTRIAAPNKTQQDKTNAKTSVGISQSCMGISKRSVSDDDKEIERRAKLAFIVVLGGSGDDW